MRAVTVRLQDTVYSSVQQLEILAEDAETAEVEGLMAVQAEALLGE